MKSNKPKTRKGHCVNYTNCALADNGDVQEIPIGDDFICSLCRLELEEEPPKPKKIWLWMLVAIVMIVVAVLLVRQCNNIEPESIETDTIFNQCGDTVFLNGKDTIRIGLNAKVQIDTCFNECGDTLFVRCSDTMIRKTTTVYTVFNRRGDTIIKRGCDTLEIRVFIKKPTMPDTHHINPPKPIPQITSKPVYGNYYGPRNTSGEPHGKGGRVEVTVEYHWGHYVFSPGDRIVNTTYEYGQLRHGKVIRKDGNTYQI